MNKWIPNFIENLKWEIQKGRKVLAHGSEYEYSVIRENSELRLKSLGWPNENKIILFSSPTSGGDNSLNLAHGPATEKRINSGRRATKLLADALNKESL